MSDYDNPHLRFLLSDALHAKTLQMLDVMEHSEDPTQHHEVLGDVVIEMIREGMHYYFVKPQELARVGILSINSTNLGIAGFMKMSSPIVRKTFRSMDKEQLMTICGFIRELMR